MRLLQVLPDGEVGLTEHFGEAIPRYAVFSHRWDKEEITFQDVLQGTGRDKNGFSKLQFCRDQAIQEGFEYFWIDTCCIDKSSSTELSEAINSMYRIYEQASVCWVFLSDVSINKRKRDDEDTPLTWEPAFRASKWFTRGWTLQELIGPRHVKFFDCNGTILGTKAGLKEIISSITHVPVEVLDGASPLQYSIAQRMSWAASRRTTRIEDMAYSLMGLFDVNMPLLYGEGEKAFMRLQEEIMKQSDDQSIFAWKHRKRYAMHGLLAQSPAAFADSYNIVPMPNPRPTSPFALTHLGLRIQLQVSRDRRTGLHAALLNCMDQTTEERIGIHLMSLRENVFLRTRLDQFVKTRHRRSVDSLLPFETQTIYVPQRRLSTVDSLRTHKFKGACRADAQVFHRSRVKRGIAAPVSTTMCGMCRRCPARSPQYLPRCFIRFALPFG